jgi:hypothetical protein
MGMLLTGLNALVAAVEAGLEVLALCPFRHRRTCGLRTALLLKGDWEIRNPLLLGS